MRRESQSQHATRFISGLLRQPVLWLAAGIFLLMTQPVSSALEHHFLYFPTPNLVATPQEYGLDYEEVRFEATDGTLLNGWLIPGRPEFPLVLFCMGNAGNMSYRLDNLQFLRKLGASVFIFDYRGYGQSRGKASEAGLYSDAEGALEFLRQRGWQTDRMIFFGRSLGAAVALQTALQHPPASLVLESPFTSMQAMGRTHYPLLYLLLGWVIEAKYDNLAKINRLESPLLIFHGEQDSICPPAMARTLYERAPEPKELVWLSGANHNETFALGGQPYRGKWKHLLQCYGNIKKMAAAGTR